MRDQQEPFNRVLAWTLFILTLFALAFVIWIAGSGAHGPSVSPDRYFQKGTQ